MNAQPIQPNTLLDDLHPKRFLQVSDLLERWNVQQLTVTISRMMSEETIPNPKDLDPKTADKQHPNGKPRVVMQPVLYFKTKPKPGIEHISKPNEFPRGYLVSAQVDVESLKSSTGAKTTGELTGKRIIIFVGEHRKQAVLRISPVPPEPETVK